MIDNQGTILYVDDDKDSCELMSYVFKTEGYKILSVNEPEEGLSLARQGGISAIILDYRISGKTGVELCREIRDFDALTPIVFYTGYSMPEDQEAALNAGAQAYLVKPMDFDKLTSVIPNIIAMSNNKQASASAY